MPPNIGASRPFRRVSIRRIDMHKKQALNDEK
jgi:hypothetical protein